MYSSLPPTLSELFAKHPLLPATRQHLADTLKVQQLKTQQQYHKALQTFEKQSKKREILEASLRGLLKARSIHEQALADAAQGSKKSQKMLHKKLDELQQHQIFLEQTLNQVPEIALTEQWLKVSQLHQQMEWLVAQQKVLQELIHP